MFKAIGRLGRDKATFKVTFEPISIEISSPKPTNALMIFQRGDAKAENTKYIQVKKSGTDFNQYMFTKESFSKECTFFMDKGVVEPKTAIIQICEVMSDKEVVVFEEVINLSQHIGAQFENGHLQELKVKKPGNIQVRNITYRVIVEIVKDKDKEIFN